MIVRGINPNCKITNINSQTILKRLQCHLHLTILKYHTINHHNFKKCLIDKWPKLQVISSDKEEIMDWYKAWLMIDKWYYQMALEQKIEIEWVFQQINKWMRLLIQWIVYTKIQSISKRHLSITNSMRIQKYSIRTKNRLIFNLWILKKLSSSSKYRKEIWA